MPATYYIPSKAEVKRKIKKKEFKINCPFCGKRTRIYDSLLSTLNDGNIFESELQCKHCRTVIIGIPQEYPIVRLTISYIMDTYHGVDSNKTLTCPKCSHIQTDNRVFYYLAEDYDVYKVRCHKCADLYAIIPITG